VGAAAGVVLGNGIVGTGVFRAGVWPGILVAGDRVEAVGILIARVAAARLAWD